MADSESEHQTALVAALLELDRHLSGTGWDQPTRLFALVRTDELAVAEPGLAAQLGLRTSDAGGLPDALTAIEQEDFDPSGDLLSDLAGIEWPPAVFGCAISTERTFLPAAYEADLPADSGAAAQMVASHPERQEIRVVVGVDRSGNRHGVARLASRPEELLGAEDLVPSLAAALAHTLT